MNDSVRVFNSAGPCRTRCLTLLLSCFAVCALAATALPAAPQTGFRLSTFSADVTPPIGHVLFTGRWKRAQGITSKLDARGFVLLPPGNEKPIVYCAVDWSEIRNEAYDQWRDVLARAAGTTRTRVLVSSIHQHDAPLADLEAQKILERAGSVHQVIDLKFHEEAVSRVAQALKKSLATPSLVTHLGVGQAIVEKIASNRRYLDREGKVHYNRMSSCRNLVAQLAGEGEIDPMLKSLSFWNEDTPLCVLSIYATHPMSYYGTSKVDADFPGLARAARQKETPKTMQIYASGCSGNVTAGKYNDGRPGNRTVLADRLHRGMAAAFESTQKEPLHTVEFRCEALRIEPRSSSEFTRNHLEKVIQEKDDARSHGMAAIGLSWLRRAKDPGHRIDVPLVRFNDGAANLLLLPAEIYVEYQLHANKTAGQDFVATIGYGECAPGYIPTERAWKENDSNLRGWCWVEEGMQKRIEAVIEKLLSD